MSCPVHPSTWLDWLSSYLPIRRQPKVEFYSYLRGLETAYPILPANRMQIDWRHDARDRTKALSKNYDADNHVGTHRCSGITQLTQVGWILTTWHDILIRTTGDGTTVHWAVPNKGIVHALGNAEPLTLFHPHQYADLDGAQLPAQTVKSLVKVHSPWRFRISRGWGLMMVPLEYMSESRFTSAVGIINHRHADQLNAVLYWHVMKGETLVKAGTPLCQLIPIPLTPVPTEVRSITNKELAFERLHALAYKGTWSRNRHVLNHLMDLSDDEHQL